MPFIETKITTKLTKEQKDSLTKKYGEALPILHKPENFLMVGFEDNYSLYMAGKALEKGAFVSVALFGQPKPKETEEFTAKLTEILGELDIPADKIYITYTGIENWGWNGKNF